MPQREGFLFNGICSENEGWTTPIDFTARDNPKVTDVKEAEIHDDSIMRELDESGIVKSLGLK